MMRLEEQENVQKKWNYAPLYDGNDKYYTTHKANSLVAITAKFDPKCGR